MSDGAEYTTPTRSGDARRYRFGRMTRAEIARTRSRSVRRAWCKDAFTFRGTSDFSVEVVGPAVMRALYQRIADGCGTAGHYAVRGRNNRSRSPLYSGEKAGVRGPAQIFKKERP